MDTGVCTAPCPTRPECGLHPWEEVITRDLADTVGCEGKHVLEIGGDLPADRALGVLKAAHWTSVDLSAERPLHSDRYVVMPADARALPFPDDSFDVAFSSCAFEHIQDLPRALAEIKRVLRPHGELFACWGPIWSAAVGHHLWVSCAGRQLDFNHHPIAPWAHLLHGEPELASLLASDLPAQAARDTAHWIHHDPYLNRLFCDDYLRVLDAADFPSGSVDPWGPDRSPSPAQADRLEAAWPGKGPFHVYGLRCHAVLGR